MGKQTKQDIDKYGKSLCVISFEYNEPTYTIVDPSEWRHNKDQTAYINIIDKREIMYFDPEEDCEDEGDNYERMLTLTI